MGFSCWIGERQQRRRVGGVPLMDRLDDRELAGSAVLRPDPRRGPRGRRRHLVRARPGRLPVGGRVDGDAGRHRAPAARPDAARRAPRPVPGRAARARRARAPQARAVAAPARRSSRPATGTSSRPTTCATGRATRRWRWPTWRASSGSTPRSSGRATSSRCSAAEPPRYVDRRHARPARPPDASPAACARWGACDRDRRLTASRPRSTGSPPATGRTSCGCRPRRRPCTGTSATTTGSTIPGPRAAPRRAG